MTEPTTQYDLAALCNAVLVQHNNVNAYRTRYNQALEIYNAETVAYRSAKAAAALAEQRLQEAPAAFTAADQAA